LTRCAGDVEHALPVRQFPESADEKDVADPQRSTKLPLGITVPIQLPLELGTGVLVRLGSAVVETEAPARVLMRPRRYRKPNVIADDLINDDVRIGCIGLKLDWLLVDSHDARFPQPGNLPDLRGFALLVHRRPPRRRAARNRSFEGTSSSV